MPLTHLFSLPSYPDDSLWDRLVNENDSTNWKKLAIEYLKSLLRKRDQPKWKIEAARIILYNYEQPETSYSTIAEEVGCSTSKVIEWVERWNSRDIKKLKPDKQSRNIGTASLLTIPAVTTYVPATIAMQQIEAIGQIDIKASFERADSNSEIRYVKDSLDNLGKSNFKDILEMSTGIKLSTLVESSLNTFFFKIGSLNFAIHYFDDEQGKPQIMVFGSPDTINWSQAIIIKGQVEVGIDGMVDIINTYRYLSPQGNLIGGLIIPVYQGKWDVWFNPIVNGQPISEPASLTALVHHDNEVDNISLDPELFHSEFPTLTLPSYTETIEKDFNNLSEELSAIFYSDEMANPLEREDGLNFLKELFNALIDTLTNPEKLANILADTAIISPGLYLCWELVKKIRNHAEKKNSTPLHQISSKCEKLLSYFERVPKSRIAEVSFSTGISVEEANLLLRLMGFVHQSNCFWHPPLQNKRGNRKKRRRDARRRAG